jgi:hypothetical protein
MLLFSSFPSLFLASISLFALLNPSAILPVNGCSAQSADVSPAQPSKGQPDFFGPGEVRAHMNWVMASNLDRYHKDGFSTLSCVDARSDDPVIGTPGGDLAEFAMGLFAYNNLTGKVQNFAEVQALFRKFMDQHISASRPFYFHTDDTRLKQVFAAVGAELKLSNITILPMRRPPASEATIWLGELVKSYAQGCGHIRLMIESPALYGLTNANIIQWLIRAFYEELWLADTDAKRAKLAFVVKLGPLQGKAVAIVRNAKGTCTDYSPAIPPNLGGSSLFVYTPSAASAFRSVVMTPFFANEGSSGWNATRFMTIVNNVFNSQLGATLTFLIPANQSSLISIDVTTVGNPEVTVAPSRSLSGASTTHFLSKWLIPLMCCALFASW